MHKAFEGGELLGDEIVAIGESLKPLSGGIIGNKLLKADADLHLPEQESICADSRKAMADLIARQRKLNDTRRKWLDGELDKLDAATKP